MSARYLKGDAALQATADVLRHTMRKADTVCRYGGEEFLVVLPDTSADEATVLATRMFTAVHSRGEEGMQVILNGYKHIGAYDLATGKSLWTLTGGGDVPVPTPVVAPVMPPSAGHSKSISDSGPARYGVSGRCGSRNGCPSTEENRTPP